MITVEIKKWSEALANYLPHRQEAIDVQTAQQMIEVCEKKVPVQGFYQYSFRLQNQVFVIYTLNADLVAFITQSKQG